MNFTSAAQDAATTISRMWADQVERLLVTEIEKAEGYVPSNEEVVRFSMCQIHADGARNYMWRGKCILRVDSWRVDDDGQFVLEYSIPESNDQ